MRQDRQPKTVEELRQWLELSPGQLLTNSVGQHADILSVNSNGTVNLGVLNTGKIVCVPLAHILPHAPENPEG